MGIIITLNQNLYKKTSSPTTNMGRIKTTLIKRKTKELLKKHGDKFTTDFSQNKHLTNQYASISSKKLRNIVAGYMTRLRKKEQ